MIAAYQIDRASAGWATLAGLLGATAAATYVVVVVAGGWATPGYNHIAHAISELTAADAPHRGPLGLTFVIYDLLLIAFAIVLPAAFGGRRGIVFGSALLAVVGLAGLGMSTVLPTDRPGDAITTIGWAHIGLAAAASLGSMAAILAFALALRQRPKWRAFAIFSFFSLAAIFLSGLWAAATAVQLSPITGLAERVTIGIFILWLLAFSLRLIGPTAAELEATAERASG